MPIYEYECTLCRQRVELMQRFSDPPPGKCECGGAMRKLLSPPGIIFKGSGFYTTDYARQGQPKEAESGGNGAKPSPTQTEEAKKD